jgi:hypothetical protein
MPKNSKPRRHGKRWRINFLDADGARQWETFRTYREAADALHRRKAESEAIRTGVSPRPLAPHTFESVSAGFRHTCGVRGSGSVECWGVDYYGQSTPPSGTFDSVSAGEYYTCGVTSSGSVECWGNDNFGQSTPPSGTFKNVSAGNHHTCGVTSTGSVECWGEDTQGQSTPP